MEKTETTDATALSLDEVEPVDINVRGLALTVKPARWPLSLLQSAPGRSNILENISLDVPQGSMMAIIGGSGSGKTSLLNVMAERMGTSSLNQQGVVAFNGADIHKVRYAYVLQQDILQPRLTCRETMRYAADLRLPSDTTKQERDKLVEEIILELGLKDCANTLVGDTEHKGLSGGEKRRLSIGIQLLANPSVLFLDEPTTGLDANSAYLVVKTCHQLAAKGRTLVMSIHQPRSDIFFLFDSVTILARGKSVYTGSVQQVLPYFTKQGYDFPEHMNPADRLIDLAAIDTRTEEQEEETTQRVQRLQQLWENECEFKEIERRGVNKRIPKMKAPLAREIIVLTRRSAKLSYRDPMGLMGLFLECTLLGVMCGLVFLKLDGSLTGIRSTLGMLYISVSLQGYLMLLYETYRLCGPDLRVFDREYRDGCVSVTGYLVSRRLSKCLTEDLFVPLIFSAIVYFMAGLRTDDAKHYFIFFASTLIMHYISMTYATFAASVSRDFTNAALIGNLGYTLQSMACGYFVNADHMPVYVKWTKWIAYAYYALGAVVSNQFTGWFGDCPYEGGRSNPMCQQYTGEFIIKGQGFPVNWVTVPLFVNVAWAVGFYVVAALLLKYLRVSISVSKQHTPKKEQLTETVSKGDQAVIPIHVNVRNVVLSVRKRGFKKNKDIEILKGITANFKPGSVNAILGPSGSGKSSLLNYVAGRLNSSALQKYTSSGEISMNDTLPTREVIQSLCSYVTQDDEGLLPSLTVRETLYYAAYLRLPSHMTRAQKRATADDIIRRMGLKDCVDTLIGDEFVKGISGGEKRRVTICVQLLNDPKILLLDEPTSGLDAFTAASIMQVLEALANEGRTIICTIHQPRSDLFPHFGNLLLLARGGRVAYNGESAQILEYFEKLGNPCPALTNPSDHLLDLVSVNLQSSAKEQQSRENVAWLLDKWDEQQEQSSPQLERQVTLPAEFQGYVRKPTPGVMASQILISRAAVNFSRSPHMIVTRVMQAVGIGIIFCLYFAPLKDSAQYGVQNRLGLVQEITALFFIGMLNNMAVYPKERSVFYREFDDNVYGVLPFFITYTALEVPFEVVTGLVFSVFFVIIPDLERSARMFFASSYCAFITVNCGESIGIMFNTVFMHEGFAVNIISVILSVATMMAGIMSLDMPGFLKGLNWLSPLKYVASVLINMAFEGKTFDCEGMSPEADGTCEFGTGDKVLNNYGLKESVPKFLGALAAVVIIYRLLALAVLKINRLQLGVETLKRK